MKQFILFSAVLILGSFAQASETCKVETSDIGTIVGKGSNSSEAFEDAAEKCFDRRAALYRAKRGRSLAEDDGLVIIDICANVRCT